LKASCLESELPRKQVASKASCLKSKLLQATAKRDTDTNIQILILIINSTFIKLLQVIQEVAKRILTFLQRNATKSGHTYWLFKPKDGDYIKLYDLTSLCKRRKKKNGPGQDKKEEEILEDNLEDEFLDDEIEENPFTVFKKNYT
jgi:hypothetical protein